MYVEGGSSSYLKDQMDKSGFSNLLNELLQTKVYVGSSAGSMVMGEKIFTSSGKMSKGFNIVPFSLRPHYKRPDRISINAKILNEVSKSLKTTFYAIDDNTAIKIINDKIEVVSNGEWDKFTN